MGIAPENWGPYVWSAIHLICLGAPESFSGSDTSGYRAFFTNLASILPCKACQEHLRSNLNELSIESALAGGRETLFRWSVNLHNVVNQQLGKPVMPYEEAKRFWNDVATGKVKCFSNSMDDHTPKGLKSKKGTSDLILVVIWIFVGMLLGYLLFTFTSKGSRRS